MYCVIIGLVILILSFGFHALRTWFSPDFIETDAKAQISYEDQQIPLLRGPFLEIRRLLINSPYYLWIMRLVYTGITLMLIIVLVIILRGS